MPPERFKFLAMRRRNANHPGKLYFVILAPVIAVDVSAQSAAVSSVAPPSTVYQLEPFGVAPQAKEPEPLVDWLPIWGKDAREKGFDLPLPFGVGLTYTYIHQNMVVSDVKIEGNPLNVNIGDAATTTHTGVMRADVWVFPFLNVYGLFGDTAGVTKPTLVFPNGEVVESEVEYNRFSYGGGMTLAGGWKALFMTLDANWTTGDIVSKDRGQVGDDPIRTFTFSPRLGMLMSSGKLGTGALWVGGMFLLATSEIHGRADLSDHPALVNLIGKDSLGYSVRVEPKENWNLLVGGNWEINKRWSVTAEIGGIQDRFHAIGAGMYRF
jgi:hypothetical protein